MFHKNNEPTSNIVDIFKKMFPAVKVIRWWKKGTNSLRVRTGNGDLVFTYMDDANWRFETISQYATLEKEILATAKAI